MPLQKDVEKASLRVFQYELADGTFELIFAALFLLAGGLLWVQAAAPRSLWAELVAGPGFLIIFPGAAFLLDRSVRAFRERVTWPRSGYIARRSAPEAAPRVRRVIYIGVPVLTLAILMLIAVYRPVLYPAGPAAWQESVPLFPAFFALLLAGVWTLLAWRLRLGRFYLIALATLAAGAAIFLARMSNSLGMVVFCMAMALLLFVSGGLTLLAYLRRHPLSPEDES